MKKNAAIIGIYFKTIEEAQKCASEKQSAWKRKMVVVGNCLKDFLVVTAAQARRCGLLPVDSWRRHGRIQAGPNSNRTAMDIQQPESVLVDLQLVCEICGGSNLIPESGKGFFCGFCKVFVTGQEKAIYYREVAPEVNQDNHDGNLNPGLAGNDRAEDLQHPGAGESR